MPSANAVPNQSALHGAAEHGFDKYIEFLVANGAIPPAYLVYAGVGPLLIWFTHADNIHRLLSGTERKFDFDLLAGRRSKGRA